MFGCPVFPTVFIKETGLFPVVCFWLLCHKSIDHIHVGLFLGSQFCAIEPCAVYARATELWLPRRGFVMWLEIRKRDASRSVQDGFGHLGSFVVPHKCQNCFFCFCLKKKCHWNLERGCIVCKLLWVVQTFYSSSHHIVCLSTCVCLLQPLSSGSHSFQLQVFTSWLNLLLGILCDAFLSRCFSFAFFFNLFLIDLQELFLTYFGFQLFVNYMCYKSSPPQFLFIFWLG